MKLKIGEISKLCHVTNRTLRHYEKIKLLMPSIIDDFTGYRYYGTKDVLKLYYILQFKELGFKLKEIDELFDNESFAPDVTVLQQKIWECEQERERLEKRHKRLVSLLSRELDKQRGGAEIYFEKLPSIIVASHVMSISGYDEMEKYVADVIGPEMLRLNCRFSEPFHRFTIETDKDFKEGSFEVEYCNEVVEMGTDSDLVKFKRLPEIPLAACLNVYGPHICLREICVGLYAELSQSGYRIVGVPRFNYVNAAWNQKNPEKWITIIQVPVEKAAD